MVTNTTTTATEQDREKAAAANNTRLALREFMLQPDSIERFAGILGKRDAQFYVNSVIMAVAFKPELAECTHMSILKSALRAASLELSCDESLHQAQLVPYNNRKSGKKEAQLIIHYLGIVNLAQRTGKYRVINWSPITEGMTIDQDPLSGLHVIAGRPDSKAKTIGYFAYFEMNNGFRKSEYLTVEEIHDHAKKFSPSYNSEYSKWKDPKILPYLEQKTVIRKLMKSADLSGRAGAVLAAALSEEDAPFQEEDIISGEFKDAPATSEPAYIATGERLPDPTEETQIERPLPPTVLRSFLARKAKEIGIYQPKPEAVGLMVSMMELAFAPDKDADKIRRSCIKFLWGYDSSKKMAGPQIKATLGWLAPKEDPDGSGAYYPDPVAAQELHLVWEAEQLAKGQTILHGLEKK